MAKAAFISLYDESAYGIRMLSACLSKAGHNRHIIFLKGYRNGASKKVKLYEGEKPWEGVGAWGNTILYAIKKDVTEKEKYLLIDLLRKITPDFIGLTVNTPLKWRAIKITQLIKNNLPDIPVIWGGFEPTINPQETLGYCDIACRGEAEDAIVNLANAIDAKRDLRNIKNLCFKDGDKTIINDLNPPYQNLDILPFQDCNPEGNYFIENNRLYERPIFLFPSPNIYSTIAARGCIFQCSYCCEFYLKELYKPHLFLRRRSPENIILELEEVKKFNSINYIIFQDEIFSNNIEWLKTFVPLYKKKIGLAFTAFMFPSLDFKERLELLKEAGLSSTCLAIQSASPRIAKIYNRNFNKQFFLKAAQLIRAMDLSFYTDVITFNPAEKDEDLETTLDMLLELPQPYDMCINKLYVLPGTKLSEELVDFKFDRKTSDLFIYYSCLFWIASYFKGSRLIIKFVKSTGMFKKYPVLLKPILYASTLLGSLNKNIYKLRKIKRNKRLSLKFILAFIRRKVSFLNQKGIVCL